MSSEFVRYAHEIESIDPHFDETLAQIIAPTSGGRPVRAPFPTTRALPSPSNRGCRAGQQARVCWGWSARGPVHRPGCFTGASVAPKRDCRCQKQSVRLYSTSQKESRGGRSAEQQANERAEQARPI
jgi:hypothetical protein